ncbi:type II toxin-antitoxin system RelE/ParE family toxin [Scandinavium sp. NPDC088450]|uniref:type II toxin-antitoxin system RelE/ParE family toxin n=1 Tax=Scandinavium sp. NPDC088450 TaxID=3364514 RepID=UPI00384C7929
MKTILQTTAFQKWEYQLKDHRVKALIAARLMRLANGLVGDAKPIGDGLSELRIHFGPGYRIYFQQRSDAIVLLLCGGEKNRQSSDIVAAKYLAKIYETNEALPYE